MKQPIDFFDLASMDHRSFSILSFDRKYRIDVVDPHFYLYETINDNEVLITNNILDIYLFLLREWTYITTIEKSEKELAVIIRILMSVSDFVSLKKFLTKVDEERFREFVQKELNDKFTKNRS